MELIHEFVIEAPPEDVFAFVIDAPAVATCIPGVVIDEVVDESTFKGNLKVKVGPVTVRYRGNGYIQSIDRDAMTATIRAEGEEQGASGSVAATMVMTVSSTEKGSQVRIVTDLAIAGRVATMGRGVIEQVGAGLVEQASRRIEERVLNPVPAQQGPQETVAVRPAAAPIEPEESLAVGALLRGMIGSWVRRKLSRVLLATERFAARTRKRIDG